VRDHRRLHRLHGVEVDGAALIRGQQIRHAQHRDLVDRLEAGHATAFADVTDVVVARKRFWRRDHRRRGGGQRGLHARMQFLCGLTRGRFQLDHVGRRVDDRDNIGFAARCRDPRMFLDGLTVALDDELESAGLLATVVVRLGDLYGDAVRRGLRVEGQHAQIAQHALGCRLDAGRTRGLAIVAVAVPDADDVTVASAVLEVGEHGLRQTRVVDEAAERLGELRPIADQCRRVERTALGEAHEGRHRRPNTLDRP
jgi:hypothetical protein